MGFNQLERLLSVSKHALRQPLLNEVADCGSLRRSGMHR